MHGPFHKATGGGAFLSQGKTPEKTTQLAGLGTSP